MKRLLLILLCVPLIGIAQDCEGDCENGFGKIVYDAATSNVPHLEQYNGSFYKGERSGLGWMLWKLMEDDGTWMVYEYSGGWARGNRSGTGKTSASKCGWLEEYEYQPFFEDLIWTHTGEYVNGKRNGIGILMRADDTGYVGYWVNGKLIKTIAEF